MRFRHVQATALLLVLAATSLGLASPPEVPSKVTAQSGEVVEVVVKIDAKDSLGYRIIGPKCVFREVRSENANERVYWFSSVKGGSYHIVWWKVGESASTLTTITVPKTPAPPPLPPVPPTPPVPPSPTPPVPPTPTPTPDDVVPIPGDGFRVMVVYNAKLLSTFTEEQKAVLWGEEVRNYLKDKCVKGADNSTPEARMWPTDSDVSGADKLWRDAFNRAKSKMGSEPMWVLISTGKKGYEGKAPSTSAEMLALLKKYGG